jgi:hypothetical protein
VSLSQDPVFTELKNDFVCGTRDITGVPWSGFSGVHPLDGGAVYTTNGAGPHNIQMFVLAQDGTVLTCLPGFWNSKDLSSELELAKQLNAVLTDTNLTRAQKDAKFVELQLGHIDKHSAMMTRRSQMQGFDKKFEANQKMASSDTIRSSSGGKNGMPVFKTTDVLMHERLALQPFRKYGDFDVVAFSDYGRAKYDKKEEGSLGVVDMRPQTNERRKRREEMKARRASRTQQMQNRGGGTGGG